MADFNAVIRRAVDGLSNNTPEMRARVYEKARAAVVRQLENMSPRPPEHMLQRQLAKLDAAIIEVESEHAEALPALEPETEAVVPAVVAAPVWAEPAHEPVPTPVEEPVAEPLVYEAAPVAEPVEAYDDRDNYQREPEPAAVVSGDDWADAHMAEPERPAAAETYAVEADADMQPVEDVAYGAEPTPAPPVEAVEPVAAEPSMPTWGESGFLNQTAEPDYADLYVSRDPVESPVEAAPAYVSNERREPSFGEAYPAEPEAAAVNAEPETTWTLEPSVAPVPEPEMLVETQAETRPAPAAWPDYPEPAYAPQIEPVAEEPQTYRAPQPAGAAVPVDAVADWLQSRADEPAVSIPAASWDLPLATDPAANRVPELPEIDAGPASVSYTPTDEFPAYQEPVHVEAGTDRGLPAGMQLPDVDQSTYTTLAPAGSPAIEPDDFSQWFQENSEEQAKAANAQASGALPASTDWDDHLTSFSPNAKGVAIDQSDGMETLVGGYEQPSYRLEPKKRRSPAPLIFGVLGLLLIAGGGYAAWTFRDDIGSLVANLAGDPAPVGETSETAPATPTVPAAETPAAPAVSDTAAVDGASTEQKFTQRLRADGSEIDEGAGAAPITGLDAEGRSVSAQTVASTVEPTDAPPPPAASPTTPAAPAGTAPAGAANPAVAAGGEKLFLYEERIGQATPVAVPGSVTWSAVRETGADGKPDPQIQGRINVPERGISALVTIKRNTDNSLPASHIVEVVFSVPPDFEGGAIENLQRIAMKRTEQDRGDPLVAVTAKVTDDTYLVALNDFEDVVKRNMELLSTRGWIDIPVTYRNGRRALLTFDKGTQGANVFAQVMREWEALAPAAPAN